jgi:uncharacterized protein YybS (DUF2232 family)
MWSLTIGSAYGALEPIYKKIAYGFAIPTVIMLGVLYASVVARFLYFRILRNSKHRYSHTLVGWSVWISVLFGVWIFAFIIAGVIPFFNGNHLTWRYLTTRSLEFDVFSL